MVRKHHKVLSLILCLMLAVSAICCGTVGATAATGDTIYFRPGHWTEAGAWFSVYAWDGNGGETFVKMTEVESGVYGASLGGSYANVIFCRNDPAKTTVAWESAWNQTADLTVQSGTNCFAVNSGEWTGANGTWSMYDGGVVVPTTPTPTTPTPTTPGPTPTTPVGSSAIYFDANHWTEANAWFAVYAWNDSTGVNTFVQMTNISGTIYGADLGGSYPNVIFCRMDPAKTAVAWESAWNQTADLTVQSGCNMFKVNSGEWTGANGTWSVYGDSPIIPTNPVNPTNPTTPINPGTYTVYCKNTAGWSKVNCYMWNSETDANATWPGVAMTNIGDNVWMYTASKQFSGVIFNNGSTQTDDLTAKYGYIYDNSTNTWEVYDTSPIQVTAFSADPASDIYVGTDVALSATATSTTGTKVYYQFSVTNANGDTSVVSNFSTANKTTWTPTTAGTYTIKIDFKDDEGNENSRTIAVTVGDDSALVKPVIKSVIPTNLGLIKVGSATTVSVKAGGGITGTNLLFYKYIVTDPNGVENTPYYTLNKTYTFTPSMAGTYTVEVYVQGSDNSTVNRTYKYTATTEDITTPTVVIPTEPATTKPIIEPTTNPVIVPTTNPNVILGDVDGDGRVTVKDATYIQKHVVDYVGYETVDLAVGDLDGDGRVSIKDATAIQKLIS